jgi:hypothetical protein
MSIREAALALIAQWDEMYPGEGNSWDDCCTDIEGQIAALRKAIEESE